MMMLRAWTLLAVLVLSPVAGALEGLFHLCHGSVQPNPTCCCDHQGTRRPYPATYVSGTLEGCCDALQVQRAPTPAATTASEQAQALHLVQAVLAPVPALPPPPETLPPVWRRARGIHRATAPPLYIQHCSYLI
jgi:hypothetical protein